MANISLDSQTFFDPQSAGGKSTNSTWNDDRAAASPGGQKHDAQDHRRAATGSSPADGILISSDSESNYSGHDSDDDHSDYSDHDTLDDGQSDTSFPLIDEILPTASASDIHTKRTLVAKTAGSDNQKSGLPTLAAESWRPTPKDARDGSEKSSLGEMAEPSRATMSTEVPTRPSTRVAAASPSSSSSPKLSSPMPLQTDPALTNGAENSPRTRLAPQNDTTYDTGASDAPDSSPNEDIIDRHGSEPRRTPQFSQEHTGGPVRSAAPPVTTLPQRLSGSSRALQQDEPVIQGSASFETRQTPPAGDTTCGKNAADISHGISPRADPVRLCDLNLPGVRSPRLENDPRRESMLRRVSVSNGNRGDEAMPPRIQPKKSCRKAAVRRHQRRRSVEDADDNLDKTQETRSDNNKGIRLPPCKYRRVSSRRNISPRQAASDDEVSTSSQDDDSEWDTRPQRKSRKSSLPMRARTKATRQEKSSDFGGIGSRQVRLASPPPAQGPGEQQESVKALSTRFTELLYEAAIVRSAIVDGVTTFQLQFKADCYCSKHTGTHHGLSISQSDSGSRSLPTWRGSAGQDTLLAQSNDDVESVISVENEWEVEEILEVRKRGRGHQVLVKWHPTWEPLKKFLGTDALDDYEAQHGNITID